MAKRKPSGANYIIICSSRIAVSAATSPLQKIKAVSDGAAQLASHVEATYEGKQPDLQAISDLQHYLMDHMHEMTPEESEAKVEEMVELMDALEDQLAGETY